MKNIESSNIKDKSIMKEAPAHQPNVVQPSVKSASNIKITQITSKDSAAVKSNQEKASVLKPIDVKTASNIKATQENKKTVELNIVAKTVEVTPILKNAGSSKIDKDLVVEVSNNKSVEKTESVSDKVKETESELNTTKNNEKEEADSGIISDKSLDSSAIIINDENNAEKPSDDPVKNDEIKILDKNPNKIIDLSISPKTTDESSKTFTGAFDFLNDYFEKSNEFINSIDLTQSLGDDNNSKPKEADTLFDMVKKRADDIRNAETEPIITEALNASTSTPFPLCFNVSSASTSSLKSGKREHPILISDSELSPVAKKSKIETALLKVNIINDNAPNGFLTLEQERQLINQLIIEIDQAMVLENIMPKFEKCTSERGFLLITCTDVFSKKWLEKIVPKLTVYKTSCLRVVNANWQSKNVQKVKVFIPGAIDKASVILQRLGRMNPGLSTIGWRIFNRQSRRFGETLTLGIDENSLANLKLINYKPYYGLTRLDFQMC